MSEEMKKESTEISVQTAELSPNLPPVTSMLRHHRDKIDYDKIFRKMSTTDFVFMWMFTQHVQNTGEDRLYLSEIAERLKLPMRKVTQIVKDLKNKGLVQWKFDGTGEEGTYILFTEHSVASTQEQEDILKEFYHRVIVSYGEDSFIQLLGQLNRLEEIVSKEMDGMEVLSVE